MSHTRQLQCDHPGVLSETQAAFKANRPKMLDLRFLQNRHARATRDQAFKEQDWWSADAVSWIVIEEASGKVGEDGKEVSVMKMMLDQLDKV